MPAPFKTQAERERESDKQKERDRGREEIERGGEGGRDRDSEKIKIVRKRFCESQQVCVRLESLHEKDRRTALQYTALAFAVHRLVYIKVREGGGMLVSCAFRKCNVEQQLHFFVLRPHNSR